MNEPESIIFEQDPPGQTAEYLRLALASLNQSKLPMNPVNYSLAYTYFAGKSQALNEKLTPFFEQEEALQASEAKDLFTRFLMQCDRIVDEEVRNELLKLVAQIIGALTDIAGKTALSNEKLKNHIAHLADSQSQKDILSSAAGILEETRAFVKESSHFESEIVNFADEVNKLKSELSQARQEAMKDALTGLGNRRAFDAEMDELIQDRRQSHSNFCVIIADLDFFKNVNDTYGHIIGDKVLCAFATVLSSKTREADNPARFGGDEFAVLLPNTNLGQAETVAEHIRKAVENLRLKNTKTGKQLEQVTVSMGVTCYKRGETSLELLERCDSALYRAKEKGRNRVVTA